MGEEGRLYLTLHCHRHNVREIVPNTTLPPPQREIPGVGRGRKTVPNTTLSPPQCEIPGPVCMEKGFATLPVNATQPVATVAVRIWFGSHA